jgi:GTP cyclohydrolase I
VDVARLERLCREFLHAIGEDPERDGLRDTPRRFAQMWREFIEFDAGAVDTVFPSVGADQMVVVRRMKVSSFCEHHILPFDAEVTVGYIAKDCVVGLSKFGRIAHLYAHRLQIQERLANQIADHVIEVAGTDDVAVAITGQHSCMSKRGVKTEADMVTCVTRGRFRHDLKARSEFMSIAGL